MGVNLTLEEAEQLKVVFNLKDFLRNNNISIIDNDIEVNNKIINDYNNKINELEIVYNNNLNNKNKIYNEYLENIETNFSIFS